MSSELARGSAIVALPNGQGSVRIYFEGNTIGAANLGSYRAKAVQAASRMLHSYPAGYPTRAREEVDPREVVEIGHLEPGTWRLEITARIDELSWWIDRADLKELGIVYALTAAAGRYPTNACSTTPMPSPASKLGIARAAGVRAS